MIDDGSVDSSLEIIRLYSEQDKRIKVITQNNRGVSFSRNIGIKESTGEYIGFVDIDDYIDQEMFEKIYTLAKLYNSDMHICGFYEITDRQINEFSNPLGEFKQLKGDSIKDTYFKLIAQGKDNALLSVWNKIYKSEFLKKHGILFNENKSIGEDRFFNIDVMMKSSIISCQNDKLYYYNHNNEMSATKLYNEQTLNKFIQEKREIISLLNENLQEESFFKSFEQIQYNKIFYQLIYYSMLEIKKKDSYKNKILRVRNIFNIDEFSNSLDIIKTNSIGVKVLKATLKLKLYSAAYILLYFKSRKI